MPILSYTLTALGAYLLGSIPTGFLVAKAKGIDIRSMGSGNIGATNALRVLGKPAGILVLLMDALKGFAAVKWLSPLILHFVIHPVGSFENLPLYAGIFAVLGHNYTCWLKFKGGKGIATTAGVYLALAPTAIGIAIIVFVLTVAATRYVSLGSIVAAIALPIAVYWTCDNETLGMVTLSLGALAVYKHKSNIQRLLAGTENRLGQKKESK